MNDKAALMEAGFSETQIAFYHNTVGLSANQMLELGIGNLEALYGVVDAPETEEQPAAKQPAKPPAPATRTAAKPPTAVALAPATTLTDEQADAIIAARKAFTARVFPVRTLRGFSQYLQGMPSAALLQQLVDNEAAGYDTRDLLQEQLSKWLARDGLIKCKRLRSNQTTRAQEALIVNTLKEHTYVVPVLRGLCEAFEHEAQELNDCATNDTPTKPGALMRMALAVNTEQLEALVGKAYEANIVEWCLAVEALLTEVAGITGLSEGSQLITALLTAGTATPASRNASAAKDLDAMMEAALADLGIDL